MRYRLIWLFGLLGLLGCSGGSDPVISAITPTLQVPGPALGVSLASAERSGSVTSGAPPGAAAPVQAVEFDIDFIDDNQVARISVNGVPTFLVFDGFNQYDDADGGEVLAFSEGLVDGVFEGVEVVGMTYRDAEAVLPHVFGNATPIASLPQSGSADYSGHGLIWTNATNTSTAAVSLNANFLSGQMTGRIREALFGAPDVDLTMAATPIVNGAFSGALASETGSVTLDHGTMTGQFFGDEAGHVAGTILVVSPVGTSSGYYIAEDLGG